MKKWKRLYAAIEPQIPNAIQVADATADGVENRYCVYYDWYNIGAKQMVFGSKGADRTAVCLFQAKSKEEQTAIFVAAICHILYDHYGCGNTYADRTLIELENELKQKFSIPDWNYNSFDLFPVGFCKRNAVEKLRRGISACDIVASNVVGVFNDVAAHYAVVAYGGRPRSELEEAVNGIESIILRKE